MRAINPGTFGDTGNFITSGLLNLHENFFTSRLIHVFTEKDTLSATYIYDNGPETVPDNLGNTQTLLSAASSGGRSHRKAYIQF